MAGQGFEDSGFDARDTEGGSVFGKFTEPVKTHLDEPTYNRWLQMCAGQHKLPGVLLRDLIYLVVHGKTPAEFAAERTRELLSGEGLNAARARMVGARDV